MAAFGVGPNLATYGSRGRNASLAAYGQDQQAEADKDLAGVATEETKRNAQNTMAATAAKQGNEQLGATVGAATGYAAGAAAGAEAGSSIGPWGTLIGGVVGALAGAFFS